MSKTNIKYEDREKGDIRVLSNIVGGYCRTFIELNTQDLDRDNRYAIHRGYGATLWLRKKVTLAN